MTPPIFVVYRNGELLMFRSAEAACAYIESIDVKNGEYRSAYDAIGCRLVLEVPEPTEGRMLAWIMESIRPTPVTIRMLSEEAEAADELRQILLRTFGVADAKMSLADLVERAKQELSFL